MINLRNPERTESKISLVWHLSMLNMGTNEILEKV